MVQAVREYVPMIVHLPVQGCVIVVKAVVKGDVNIIVRQLVLQDVKFSAMLIVVDNIVLHEGK